jgi:hypothetical protein
MDARVRCSCAAAIAAAVAAVALAGCRGAPPGSAGVNLDSATWYFSGSTPDSEVPQTALLRDSTNNQIAWECIAGASVRRLRAATPVPDLDQRLRALAQGRVVRTGGGRCAVGFPVLAGGERRALAEIVDRQATALVPLGERMIARLVPRLGERREMAFHVLWSRVMDASWGDSWNAAFPGEELPTVVWLVDPPSALAVGTNFEGLPGSGDLAMTWSEHSGDYLRYFHQVSYDLYRLAWGQPPRDSSVATRLRAYGVFDASGRSRLFAYPQGGALDSLLTGMSREYAAAVANAYDWSALARRFHLSPGQLFVIVLHETAYALLDDLQTRGRLDVPAVLLGGGGPAQSVALVSLRLGAPPRAFDEAMARYLSNGAHGDPSVVRGFEDALTRDPENAEILWYLGLSLYDVRQYRRAVGALARLARATEHDSSARLFHDWSRIWIGHCYDALGDRARALAAYRGVARSSPGSGLMMMSQYHIGPITAQDWAAQRIAAPFRVDSAR